MGVKGQPDIIEEKRLQWYGHVKRMPEERIPNTDSSLAMGLVAGLQWF